MTKDGEAWLAFGVRAATFSPRGHVEILTNLIDFGMNLREALRRAWVPPFGEAQDERRASAATGIYFGAATQRSTQGPGGGLEYYFLASFLAAASAFATSTSVSKSLGSICAESCDRKAEPRSMFQCWNALFASFQSALEPKALR